ncbi:hypothetical protein HC776_03485 [bacterium]|nr:hypothetical protein [bacterium]
MTQTYQALEIWTTVDGQCVLREAIIIEAHVSYPMELADQSPFAKSVILDYINEERRNFWQIGEWLFEDRFDPPNSSVHLNIKSELFRHSDTIASVLFTRFLLEGQGRLVNLQTFTFDLQANKTLTLDDIFLEEVDPYPILAPIAQKGLQTLLGDTSINLIIRNTVPIPENYQYWGLTNDSLLIFFSGYDVIGIGAAIGNTKTVEVPLSTLKDYLKPEFYPKSVANIEKP